ncbi:SPFH domain-containing protein [Streptomyces pratensis]|uniref:SPFH domain-containing protein n=1 Tax=Streptomyces pratensis TaxID=1169025 RepID=UPI001EE470AF|nr:SPFH domain-containing protein [Streptomyces pratensis]
MRSIENVRGEWDELGERYARVVPAPGAGEAPAQMPPATETGLAGLPGPGAEPEPLREPAEATVGDASAAVDEPSRAGAPLAVREPAAVDAPVAVGAPLAVGVPPAPEDESIPADLGPAMDAVAGVGRAAPVDVLAAADLGPGPDLDLDLARGPELPEPAPEQVTDPPRVPDAAMRADTESVTWAAAKAATRADVEEVTRADSGAVTRADAESVTWAGFEPVTRADAEAITRPDVESVTWAGFESVTRTDAEAVTRADVEAVTRTNVEAVTWAGFESVTRTNVEAVTRADVEAATRADVEAATRADVEAATRADVEAATRADTEAVTWAGVEEATRAAAEPVATRAECGREPGAGPDLRKSPPGGALRAAEEKRAAVTLTVGAADPVAWWGTGRRQPVISTESTAPIPVHLLFRDDGHGDRPPGTGGTAAGTGVAQRSGVRRPPLPRSPQRQAPTRPAPLADPRLTERPGPVLPGWAALSTAAAVTAAGLAVLWWQGAVPATVTGRLGLGPRPYDGIGTGAWALLGLLAAVVLFALRGLGRGRAGHASVLTLFGGYRGSVRRTGLLWISPLLRRRRIDVRLRHWRSEPLHAVDASGTALRVVVLVVWRVKDTARAMLGVADHERYLRDQVEAALARVLSQLPADAFHEDTHTLRDAEAVGDALTRMVKADCVPVGIEVYSAQPTGIEYAPEVAAAMQRCRVAAIDAKHRDGVLTSVVDAVDDTVGRLTARGIVELDAYEHKALVRDLTVAFYTGRSAGEGA